MLYRSLWITLLSVITFVSYSQLDEDEPCMDSPSNKKVLKALAEARSSKYDYKKRFELIRKAIAINPECAECWGLYGKLSYNKALSNLVPPKVGEDRYKFAKKFFNKAIEMCPDYHSDPFYYLGKIYYEQREFANAYKNFDSYINYKVDDDHRYARAYDKRVRDIKEILPELKIYDEIFNNPAPFNPTVVSGIATTKDEYLPSISPDNQYIFFTRVSDAAAQGDFQRKEIQEITMSYRPKAHGAFELGEAMKDPFNVAEKYGGVSISIDNKEMYVCVCEPIEYGQGEEKRMYDNCDIFVTNFKKQYNESSSKYEYTWSALENLGENINTKFGWEGQPSLSGDGNTLFFAVNKQGTRGTDIYYSERMPDNTWAKARPVPGINSSGSDKSPYVHSDSKTLYFASDCVGDRIGVGGFDIFYTRLDSTGNWITPKNLGYPINSELDEHGMIVSTDGHYGYFASNRINQKNGFDIYRFDMPEKARPEKVILIKGQLKDDDGNEIHEAELKLKYKDSKREEIMKINTDDGKYAAIVNVEDEEDLVMTIKKKGHAFSSKLIKVKEAIKETYITETNLKVHKIEVGKPYTINDIIYATASSELPKESMFILDEFVDFLKENKSIKIGIQGHTDNVGDANSNLELSTQRAIEVKSYLISQGIAVNRLSAKGFGHTKPKVKNTSEKNRAMNRRTDFVIISI